LSLLRPADTEVKLCLGNKKIPKLTQNLYPCGFCVRPWTPQSLERYVPWIKQKKSNPTFKKPDFAAMRQAVASSTAIETGQSIHVLEQKLKNPSKRRFADIKLAD